MFEYLIEIETGHFLIVKDGARYAEFIDHAFGLACYNLLMSIEVEKLRAEIGIDNKQEYILCAAIKRLNPRDCPKLYVEKYQDIYSIEVGWRHMDILHRFTGEVHLSPQNQGFYTSYGRYVSREEAAKIAFNCGQIKEKKDTLFSEDIY